MVMKKSKYQTAQLAINYEEAIKHIEEVTSFCISDIGDKKTRKKMTKQIAANKTMYEKSSPAIQFENTMIPDSKVVVLTKNINIEGKGEFIVEDNFLIYDCNVPETHTLQSIELIQLTGNEAGRIYSNKEISYRTFKNKTTKTYEVQITCKDYAGKFLNTFTGEYYELPHTCKLYCDGFARTFFDPNKIKISSFYNVGSLGHWETEKEYTQHIFDDYAQKCLEEQLKKEEQERKRQLAKQKLLEAQQNKPKNEDNKQSLLISKEQEERMINHLIQLDPYKERRDREIEQ